MWKGGGDGHLIPLIQTLFMTVKKLWGRIEGNPSIADSHVFRKPSWNLQQFVVLLIL